MKSLNVSEQYFYSGHIRSTQAQIIGEGIVRPVFYFNFSVETVVGC